MCNAIAIFLMQGSGCHGFLLYPGSHGTLSVAYPCNRNLLEPSPCIPTMEIGMLYPEMLRAEHALPAVPGTGAVAMMGI